MSEYKPEAQASASILARTLWRAGLGLVRTHLPHALLQLMPMVFFTVGIEVDQR